MKMFVRMKRTGFLTHKYVQIFSYDQYQITYKTFSAVSYHFILANIYSLV